MGRLLLRGKVGYREGDGEPEGGASLISQKIFIKSFRESQFPHKSVTSFFILVTVKDKLTDLWGS